MCAYDSRLPQPIMDTKPRWRVPVWLPSLTTRIFPAAPHRAQYSEERI